MGNSKSHSSAAASPASSPRKGESDRRTKICQEILSTEETYVRGLTTLDRYYRTALSEAGIKTKTVNMIFSSVPDILRLHYDTLLPQLQLCCTASAPAKRRWCVARVFLDFGKQLELYSVFVNNYETAVHKVMKLRDKKKKVAEVMDNAKALQETNGLDFFSLFITIVQRLPRYCLLLADLIKHVPDTDKEHALLEQAKQGIATAADQINERKRTFEEMATLGQLARDISSLPIKLNDPSRRILESTDVQTNIGSTYKDSHLWLFNDSLLIAKEQSGLVGLFSKKWKLRLFSPLETLQFEAATTEENVIVIRGTDAAIRVRYARLAADHMARLQQARLDVLTLQDSASKRKNSVRASMASFFGRSD